MDPEGIDMKSLKADTLVAAYLNAWVLAIIQYAEKVNENREEQRKGKV